MTVSVVWLAFGAAISEDRNGVVDADHVTRPEYAYRFCFVLFCHQSHATPGDHGAMYTLSDSRPQSAQRRLIARPPLPSVQACPKKLYSEDGGSIAQRVTHRVVCQGRRKSKRDRPVRQPGKQPHRQIRSPRCSGVWHPLSLTIVLPQLHRRGSKHGASEVLFGRKIGLFSDEQVCRRCT